MKDFGSDKKNVVQANLDAQKIAFAPIIFQAAKSLRNLGKLDYLFNKDKATVETIAAELNLSVYGVKVLLEDGLSLEMVWDTVYIGLSELPEKIKKSWFDFDHFYSDYTFPEIMPILFDNNPKSFLDVRGNTGKFSMQCAKYDPNVKITILDLPGQANVARKNIAEAGFEDRISAIDSNLLDIQFRSQKEMILYG